MPTMAAESSMPRFYLDYAVVSHSLKNDEGHFEELMAIAKAHPQKTDFIAEFWWAKAKKECHDTFDEIVRRYASQVKGDTSAAEKSKLEKEAKAEADQCVYGVYYDHWDEINQMIIKRFEQLKKETAR